MAAKPDHDDSARVGRARRQLDELAAASTDPAVRRAYFAVPESERVAWIRRGLRALVARWELDGRGPLIEKGAELARERVAVAGDMARTLTTYAETWLQNGSIDVAELALAFAQRVVEAADGGADALKRIDEQWTRGIRAAAGRALAKAWPTKSARPDGDTIARVAAHIDVVPNDLVRAVDRAEVIRVDGKSGPKKASYAAIAYACGVGTIDQHNTKGEADAPLFDALVAIDVREPSRRPLSLDVLYLDLLEKTGPA